jgi:polar amino acid transport system substrate-binding protein
MLIALLLLIATAVFPAVRASAAIGDEPVTLMFNERTLYKYRTHDGKIVGLLPNIVEQTLETAGIKFVWREVPLARQKDILVRNDRRACAVGLYKPMGWKAPVLVSRPIYREAPYLLVQAKHGRGNDTPTSLEKILHERGGTIALGLGRNYGKNLDDLIASNKDNFIIYNKNDLELINLALSGHTRYTIIESIVFSYYVANANISSADFFIYTPGDMPHGETRHMVCTLGTGLDVMTRFDANLPNF